MSGQRSGPDAREESRVLVCEGRFVVYDRGLEPAWHKDRRLYGPWWRYEAELAGFEAVRELGTSPWEAVYRLVANHRALLARRWSEESVAR